MILEVFSSGPFETNVYILGCSHTKKACIIDAPPDCLHSVVLFLRQNQLSAKKLLLTHSHWDHIADVYALKQELHLPVYVHPADEENLSNPGSDGLSFLPTKPIVADAFLKEGDVIHVGDLSLEVIETPGHTPGGVCFYMRKENVLFSGDTLFQGTMGRVDFPGSRPASMWESLKKLSHLPPDTIVYPGHGSSTTIGRESWIADPEKRWN